MNAWAAQGWCPFDTASCKEWWHQTHLQLVLYLLASQPGLGHYVCFDASQPSHLWQGQMLLCKSVDSR